MLGKPYGPVYDVGARACDRRRDHRMTYILNMCAHGKPDVLVSYIVDKSGLIGKTMGRKRQSASRMEGSREMTY